MLAQKGTTNQHGEWLAEPKYDGTRAFIAQTDGQITILHRSGKNRTNRYPELTKPYRQDLVLDGEIVAHDQNGLDNYNLIQQRQTDTPSQHLIRRLPVTYHAFDILTLAGEDLTRQPLHHRRRILEQQIDQDPHPQTHITPQVLTQDQDQIRRVFQTVTQQGYEGIMLKRPNSTYQPTRSPDWLKVKNIQTSDLWITGYTEGTGSRARHFGALLLAETPDGQPASKVGTGFDAQSLKTITQILRETDTGKTVGIDGHRVHLVTPAHRAEIEHLSSPDGKKKRFPSFKRLLPRAE